MNVDDDDDDDERVEFVFFLLNYSLSSSSGLEGWKQFFFSFTTLEQTKNVCVGEGERRRFGWRQEWWRWNVLFRKLLSYTWKSSLCSRYCTSVCVWRIIWKLSRFADFAIFFTCVYICDSLTRWRYIHMQALPVECVLFFCSRCYWFMLIITVFLCVFLPRNDTLWWWKNKCKRCNYSCFRDGGS